jgi:hypothetical protein
MVSWENLRRLVVVVLLLLGFWSLHQQGQRIKDTQAALVKTQKQLLRSNKESTSTRITTVTQRCHFTKLVIDELVLRAPASDLVKFRRSYEGCETQLAHVKAINARTPSP